MSLFDDASLVVTPNGYKAGKLYSIKPDTGAGDLDVVRATSATRVNANGLIESVGNNVPRIDYPLLGGCPSILVEPQATNLLLRSEEFDDAYWTKTFTTITANDAVAPDGTMTADKLTAATSGTDRRIQRFDAVGAGTYTTSIFVKAAELSTVRFYAVNFSAQASFSLTGAGSVFGVLGGATASIVAFPNGWYRCSITLTNFAGGAGQIFYLNLGNALSGATINAGDGVFIWGAQLEVGSVATSYIPTVASTVTRNADVISKTGISSLIGQTSGTFYVDLTYLSTGVTASGRWLRIFGASNEIGLAIAGTNRARSYVNLQSDILNTSPLTTEGIKIAWGYDGSGTVCFINGTQYTLTNGGNQTMSSLTSISIDGGVNAELVRANIRAAALLPTRLSNAQLASLTTL